MNFNRVNILKVKDVSKTSLYSYFLSSIFWLLASISSLTAQQSNYTLNRDYLWGYDNYFNSKEQSFQTFVKPYRYNDINIVSDTSVKFPSIIKPMDIKGATIHVAPIANTQVGFQASDNRLLTYDMALGGNVTADFGKNWSVNMKAFVGRGIFNNTDDSLLRFYNVVPGIGYAYKMNNDSLNAAYAYQYFAGYVSYSPHKVFNIQLGQDKHFWGDGYRSLFLSDVAAPYPYMKLTTNVWKLTYVNLYTIFRDASAPSGLKKDWMNKYAVFHYLGANITKRINVGLFESVIWQATDSTRHRGYDVNYLNPIIFFRPTEYSLGSSDNSAMGISIKIKLFNKQQIYGQFLLDDFSLKEALQRNGFWQVKYGVQAGFKSFDVFKVRNLNFQTEFNYVRPYAYTHGTIQQSYSNMNQALAHPVGANFMESVTIANYRYKRFFIEGKASYALYGIDTAGTDYGKNIFISYTKHAYEYGNKVGQGVKTHLLNIGLKTAWIVDADANLSLLLGVNYRLQKNMIATNQAPFVYIGIKTDLFNWYGDY